jgi:hypothetical protein
VGGLASDPFGEKPVPWWRTLRRFGASRAPKRYARFAGALGPIAGLFITTGDGLDKSTREGLVLGLTVIPPLLVEIWWRRRKHRQEEPLLILPE